MVVLRSKWSQRLHIGWVSSEGSWDKLVVCAEEIVLQQILVSGDLALLSLHRLDEVLEEIVIQDLALRRRLFDWLRFELL